MANIFIAIIQADIKSLEKLVNWKNVNKVIDDKNNEEQKFTPLTFACKTGKLKVVNSLFKKGAHVNAKDGKTHAPLYIAVLYGHFDVAKLLIEKGAEVNQTENKYCFTAAFSAVRGDRLDILKYLVSKKADLNITNSYGGLVRHAVVFVSVQCFDYFLQQKVDVNTINENEGKQNVFYEAVFNYLKCEDEEKKEKLLKMILKLYEAGAKIDFFATRANKNLQESALHSAARYCNYVLMESLLKMKMKVDLQSETGDTPLHSLFYLNNGDRYLDSPYKRKNVTFRCMELLLEHGTDPNIANKSGTTPFMYMMATFLWEEQDDEKVLELFLKHKAKVNAKGFRGNRPLHCAAQRCTSAMCEMLIKYNADINALNDSSETPLHSSTQQMEYMPSYKERSYKTYKKGSLTYWLLQQGAKVLKNDEGQYPHFLSTKNFLHDFHAMVEFGCDINAQAKNGNTILHELAVRGDKDDLIQIIENNATGKEFDFSLNDEDGKTIMDIAKEEGWKDVEACIQKHCKDGNGFGSETGASESKSSEDPEKYSNVIHSSFFLENPSTESQQPSDISNTTLNSKEDAIPKDLSNRTQQISANSRGSRSNSRSRVSLNSKKSAEDSMPSPKTISKSNLTGPAKPKDPPKITKPSSANSKEAGKLKQISNISRVSSNSRKPTIKESKQPKQPPKTNKSPKLTKTAKSSEVIKASSNPEEDTTKAHTTKKQRHDVMISYQWDHQEIALKIRDYLRRQGVNVWIDTEQMSGDIFTKMAEAVIGSRVVLMCLSSKYQESDNCTKEYEYTAKKKRPFIPVKVENSFEPTDGRSLDIILGMKMYYNVEKKQDFEANMPKVFNEVQELLKKYNV